jgi:hypothetical protein
MSVMVGCGGGTDTVGSPSDHADKSGPTTAFETSADEPTTAPEHKDSPRFQDVERFRDYAAFAYMDRFGQQHLSQWLLADDGIVYFSRTCPIAERNGVLWNQCDAWTHYGQPVSELGTGGFSKLNGLNSYVYSRGLDDDGNAIQYVVQTAFEDQGEQRRGRVCPIDVSEGPQWKDCTDWEKLSVVSRDLRVPDVYAFRDEMMFTYKSEAGDDMFSQTLLSVDGSQTWNRSCPTVGGSPFVTKDCEFGEMLSVRASVGVQVHAINGRGAYVYFDGAQQILAETVIGVDGTTAQRRECPIYEKGIDREGCGNWSTFNLKELHKTQGQL